MASPLRGALQELGWSSESRVSQGGLPEEVTSGAKTGRTKRPERGGLEAEGRGAGGRPPGGRRGRASERRSRPPPAPTPSVRGCPSPGWALPRCPPQAQGLAAPRGMRPGGAASSCLTIIAAHGPRKGSLVQTACV